MIDILNELPRILLGMLLALVPGFITWRWGRRLVARPEDPAFAERLVELRRRTTQATAVAAVLITFTNWAHATWLLLLLLFCHLLGWFSARRRLFEEQWGIHSYLYHVLRVTLGFAGFWILLAAAPLFVIDAGAGQWWAAGLLGGVLCIWNLFYGPLCLRFIGATPLLDADLLARFAEIQARSTAKQPGLFAAGPAGGRWVNAFALPSLLRPAVLFTRDLLQALEPRETAAIYAHELAHMEHYNRARLLRLTLLNTAGIVLSAFALPVLSTFTAWPAQWVAWLWPLIVAAGLIVRISGQKAKEAESDRRAAELCGDPDALARALTRLHQLLRFPRRLDPEMERRLSHPSLAHRIQNIESAEAPPEPPGTTPLAVGRRTSPGRALILETDHIEWLDGVPAGVPLDATSLRAGNTKTTAQQYADLCELRVKVGIGGDASLVTTDRRGAKLRARLDPVEVAPVQAFLDKIDVRLAKPATWTAGRRVIEVVLASAMFCVGALTGNLLAAVALPALIVVFYPRAAISAALGVCAMGGAVFCYMNNALPVPTGWPLLVAALWAAGGAVLIVQSIRLARKQPERRAAGVWVIAAVLAIIAIFSWAGLALGMGRSALRLHEAASSAPTSWLSLFGLAAALLFMPRRAARLAAVLSVLLGLLPLVVSTGWFVERYAHDALVSEAPVLHWTRAPAALVREIPLSRPGNGLRLSPGGEMYALFSAERRAVHEAPESVFLVGRISGERREFEAEELRFLDDRRMLVLRRRSSGTGLQVLTWENAIEWQTNVPTFQAARLAVDAPASHWRLCGNGIRAESPDRIEMVVVEGVVGRRETSERRFAWPEDGTWPAGSLYYMPKGPVSVLPRFGSDEFNMHPVMGFLIPGYSTQVVSMDGQTPRVVCTTDLPLVVLEPAFDDHAVYCLADARSRTYVWEIDSATGPSRCIATMPGSGWRGARIDQERLLLYRSKPPVIILDLEMRTATSCGIKVAIGEHLMEVCGVGNTIAALRSGTDGTVLALHRF
ncbi:MAG: M48 family metalloprotease [Acidobacteriota bacterium]